MPTPSIRLYTRGDDLGSAISANRAFCEAFEKGILRNASAMFCTPHIEDAAARLASEKRLCVGLHMTMNAEWDRVRWGPVLPPAKVPSLVDKNGHFFKTTKELHERNPSEAEVCAELQAQLDKGRRLGFTVSYADSHMGWPWVIPGFTERIARWCEKEGLLYSESRMKGLPKVEHVGDPVEQLIAKLEAAEPGDYMVVGHPAYDNAEMRTLGHSGYEGDKVATGREWERRLFSDPRIVAYCRDKGVQPTRFDAA